MFRRTVCACVLFPREGKTAGQGGREEFPSFPQKAAKSKEHPQAHGAISYAA